MAFSFRNEPVSELPEGLWPEDKFSDPSHRSFAKFEFRYRTRGENPGQNTHLVVY